MHATASFQPGSPMFVTEIQVLGSSAWVIIASQNHQQNSWDLTQHSKWNVAVPRGCPPLPLYHTCRAPVPPFWSAAHVCFSFFIFLCKFLNLASSRFPLSHLQCEISGSSSRWDLQPWPSWGVPRRAASRWSLRLPVIHSHVSKPQPTLGSRPTDDLAWGLAWQHFNCFLACQFPFQVCELEVRDCLHLALLMPRIESDTNEHLINICAWTNKPMPPPHYIGS